MDASSSRHIFQEPEDEISTFTFNSTFVSTFISALSESGNSNEKHSTFIKLSLISC